MSKCRLHCRRPPTTVPMLLPTTTVPVPLPTTADSTADDRRRPCRCYPIPLPTTADDRADATADDARVDSTADDHQVAHGGQHRSMAAHVHGEVWSPVGRLPPRGAFLSIAPHSVALHCIALRCVASRSCELHCVALHCIKGARPRCRTARTTASRR